MRMLRWFVVAALCLATPAMGYWQSRDSNYNISISGAPAGYQGPGDVFSTSAVAWYSCARAYNNAYAVALSAACDVVDSATGAITCTYHFQASGFVNPSECNGVGQSCQTACKVKQAYDQTGNTRHATQATLASMPSLTFSSTPTGTLPAMTCSGVLVLASANVTQAQPYTMSAVLKVTTGGAAGGAIGGSTGQYIGQPASANNLTVNTAGVALNAAATDNTWYSLQGLANGTGTSSAINVNGADATGSAGTGALSAIPIRLCRAGGNEFIGLIAEAGMWGASTNATNRNAISSNQHDATNGYNF